MTQILRPTTETTNDGFLYDPTSHPASVAISPAGANFPYTAGGWWYGTQLDPGQTSPFGVEGEIVDPWTANGIVHVSGAPSSLGILAQQYHTGYKAISAPNTVAGTQTKTVTYADFPVKTDGWTTGVLTVIAGVNIIYNLKTDDIDPTILAEYTTDGGSTWINIFELEWNTTSRTAGGALYWKDINETLGPSTTVVNGTGLKTLDPSLMAQQGNGVLPWWGINEGNEYATTITGLGSGVSHLKVRFTLSGGHVTPTGYPYNTLVSPYYIGVGFMLADISITDSTYTAPPPTPPTPTGATGTTGPVNANVIKTGPGAPGQIDTKWMVNTVVAGVVVGTWNQTKVMSPNTRWATLSGTNWINAGDGPLGNRSDTDAANPLTPIGLPNTWYRYKTTFVIPANFSSASLSLAMYCDDYSPRIALNGVVFGTQPDTLGGSSVNFTAPAKTYTTTASFVAGVNVLEIDVKNWPTWTGLDVLGQIDYQVTTGTGSGGGGSSITTPDYDTPILSVGGTPAYAYSIVNDAQTTLPLTACSIVSANTLRVNGSSVPAGLYTIHLRVTDVPGGTDDQIVTVRIHDNTKFNIINESIAIAPSYFPSTGSVPLVQYGGSGAVTWTLMPESTTLASASITGSTLSYTVNNFGTFQIGLLATDALGKTSSKIIGLYLTTNAAYKLVDGQIELQYVDSTGINSGSHTFSFGLADSHSGSVNRIYNFLLDPSPSPIASKQYSVNKYWSTADFSTYNLPISGAQSGIVLGDAAPVTLPNGLTVLVDSATKMAKVTGHPTTAVNSLAKISVPLTRAGVSIAHINRSYMIVPYAGTTLAALGTNVVLTVPAIVGSFFTLNVQKPYFNSPDNSRDITWKARVKTGSSLPKGISLDQNTGLLYGPVVDATVVPAGVIEFVDSQGNVKGTFNVNFNFLTSEFNLIDNLPTGQISGVYSGQIHSASTDALTSVEVIYGALPAGLTIGVSGNGITLTGTPTEAGYFDFWIKTTNAIGKIAYMYKRLEVSFISPLTIVTTALPTIVGGTHPVAYSFQMQAVGGTGKYTWTKATLPAFPTSITMTSGGLISGTTADASYSQSLPFTVTDSAGATQSVTLPMLINNALAIVTTSPLPSITRNLPYSYLLTGMGGTGIGYNWTTAGGSPSLPAGITLNPSSGLISGTTSAAPATIAWVGALQDSSLGTPVTKPLSVTVVTASASLGISTTGVGPIKRGCTYQGVLKVTGAGVAPYSWSAVSGLPTGLVLTANAADSGATCFISGSSTLTLTDSVAVVMVEDSAGNSVRGNVSFTSNKSVEILTTSLPAGRVGIAYSTLLSGQSCNMPITWALDSGTLPVGFNLNSSGALTGSTATPYSQTIRVRLTDSNGDSTVQNLALVIQSSNLQITTTSISTIPAGRAWSEGLAISGGSGTGPGHWTCSDPNSGGANASGWRVDVTASGGWGDLTQWASGTYTITATGGSGSYSGTGTFDWSNLDVAKVPLGLGGNPIPADAQTLVATKVLYYGYTTAFTVTDLVTGQSISGTLNIPFTFAPHDLFPKSITCTQTFTSSANLASVLPTGVSLSDSSILSTSGTTQNFNKDVLFTVKDSDGSGNFAQKVLNVKTETIAPPVGSLKTGIDRANGSSTGYLGTVGLYPGDIGAMSPRPNQSFYVYGQMTGLISTNTPTYENTSGAPSTAQLALSVIANNGVGPYSNFSGVVESVDSTGLVTIKLIFNQTTSGRTVLIGPNYITDRAIAPRDNSVDIVLTSTNGQIAKGTFFFSTVDTGEVVIYQNESTPAALPTFTSYINLA